MIKTKNLLEYILFLSRHLHGCKIRCIVNAILIELDIPVERMGYEFLLRGAVMLYRDCTQRLTKEIYPQVSKSFGGSVGEDTVEGEMRATVKIGWKRGVVEIWEMFFPTPKGAERTAPSNKVFLLKIVRVLQLWKDICDANEERAAHSENAEEDDPVRTLP